MDSLSLQIKDNFFTEKEYNILVDNLNKIPLSPMSNKEGNYSFGFEFNKSIRLRP